MGLYTNFLDITDWTTPSWEQRKFSDLTDRVSIQSSDSDLPQVEYEDIVSGEGTLNKDLRDKEGGKTGIKFYAGDVLYGKLRPYLMNWLYPQFNGVAVGDFWVLRATKCDSSFLYRLIQTNNFQRLANVSSGSKMPRADWNLISQSFFAVPADHAEQKAIAKSLAELDSLITLHQRKCQYRGLYEYLSWEQRKLGDLISVYIAHAGPEEDVTVLTSSRDGIQKQEDHFGRLQQHDTSDWNLIPYGYCTYRNRSDDGLFTFNVNKVADRGIVSKFYPVFETPECDADFLVAYLNSSQEIRKKLFVLAVGTSQVVLSYGALKELSLLLPQNREQSAIANVLNHIDNLITLHQ